MTATLETKTCKGCDETKPVAEFYMHGGRPRQKCKVCWNAATRADQIANPEKWKAYQRTARSKMSRRERTLRYRFGLSIADFDAMWLAQDEACGICRGRSGDETTHIDHDHATGKVRGILCGLCNRMLGQAKGDIETLLAAINYLARTS